MSYTTHYALDTVSSPLPGRVAQGGSKTFVVVFRSEGVAVDPANARIEIYDPDDVLFYSTTALEHPELGTYTYLHGVAADAKLGIWRMRWLGNIDNSDFGSNIYFVVVPPGQVAVGTYATLDEFRSYLGISDGADDVLLTLALAAAAEAVDLYCGQGFNQASEPSARYYNAGSSSSVDVDPFATTDGLLVETDDDRSGQFATAWALTAGYVPAPLNAASVGRPWDRLQAMVNHRFPVSGGLVRVTAQWGWPSPPASVKQAVLLQASRLFRRKDAPFGVAGSAEFGSEIRLLSKLDPDVEALLRPYRKKWWVLS